MDLLRDVAEFGRLWYRFLFKHGYRWFSRFEAAKDLLAQTLYHQRGRFARPFVHTAMGGLIAGALILAPVLASSFPGIVTDPAAGQSPNSVVRQVTDDGTTTQISDKVRDKIIVYTIQPGDTVSAIAAKFDVSVDTVRWENNLTSIDAVKPELKLRILPISGIAHKVSRGETIYSIAKKYQAEPQGVVDFPFNEFTDDETFALAVGQVLIVPDGKKPNVIPWSPTLYVVRRTPDAGAVSAIGQFVWPLGGLITQGFRWYHQGIDIANSARPAVLAADAGRVTLVGWPDSRGFGNRVIIDHGNGFTTLYAHLAKIFVGVGQTVNRGDSIGEEGSTGRSTGAHLHFEIKKGGVAVNPLDYLR